jgi:hypothetical protein
MLALTSAVKAYLRRCDSLRGAGHEGSGILRLA